MSHERFPPLQISELDPDPFAQFDRWFEVARVRGGVEGGTIEELLWEAWASSGLAESWSRLAAGSGVLAEQADRPRFKVNELEVIDEGTEVNAFIETTRFLGLKIRLEGQDILDMNQSRDRTIYQGLRNLSSVQRTILRDRNDGARFFVSVSGNF